MTIPQEFTGKYFYHFTHIENLESIVKNGFLSTNEKSNLGIEHKDVANGNIQERRHNMNVPISPGGTVHDYIPFYFCTTNPMLLSLVNLKNIDQMFMIFFAVPIDKILDQNVIFTDASANTKIPPNFYTNPSDLDKLNWESINSSKWGVKNDDDRHQRMAEVLIYKSLQIIDVDTIIVWNDNVKSEIEKIFKNNFVTCPNITNQPFKKKNFYYTKFMLDRPGETLTTGPIILKHNYEKIIKKIKEDRQEIKKFRFANIDELLKEIENNFCVIEELQGIHELSTANEIHHECVSDHTLNVVNNLIKNEFFKNSNNIDKNILKLSAYLHDIGKGPKNKWKDEIQYPYPDHPVDSLKMIKRILINDIMELSDYEIEMITLLVTYHDLIGEIFGKGRDKKQLFNLLKDEKQFDILNCLSYADVLSFNNNWYITYGFKINDLKKEFLEQLDK